MGGPTGLSKAGMWACIAALVLAWAGVVWVVLRSASYGSLQ